MSDIAILVGVGLLAGAINSLAGGGTLITFPVMVALGLPTLTANVTNTIAQLPGYFSITYGYRRHLKGQWPRFRAMLLPGAVGAAIGVLLLRLGGDDTFSAVVPFLVLLACALLAGGPVIRRRLDARPKRSAEIGPGLLIGISAACAYSSYFGAAGGVLMLAVLGLGLTDSLQRLNGLNRALILLANVVALPFFVALAPIDWGYVAAVAPATLIGGWAGAKYVSGLDDRVLRALVITLGVVVAVWLLVR